MTSDATSENLVLKFGVTQWRNECSTATHNAETVPQCSGGVSVGANAGDSQTFGVRTQKLHDHEDADVEQPLLLL